MNALLQDAHERFDPPLAARGLGHGYEGATVLRCINLDVAPGSVLGLIGRNGAGKSTLLRALLGLLEPTTGEARVFGTPALAMDDTVVARIGSGLVDQALALAQAKAPELIEQQRYDVMVGQLAKPAMPAFHALPMHRATTQASATTTAATQASTMQAVSTTGGLPYTIYYGNLHSQTNHSDGGGVVSTCKDAQPPQSAPYGPADAYQYAMNEGLDFLMTSEHNHMYDGSTGTNSSANPTTAHNLFQSGLQAASTFNAAHSNFLAIYGLEWGVISNGGHMNIFNTPSLLEWEYNSSNQLIGDIYTAKSDYASLYTLMHTNGWIGQFNHPASTGQFVVNGTNFGYTADGDAVMVLAEVLN
ncbi:MAG: hypothetical protein B7X33_00120, partial [Lysobacterales bacterium 13-68-4]